MKKLKAIAVLLLAAAAATGCEKGGFQDITGPLPSARIKFFNFGMGSPGVNFYANETKMTAVGSTVGAESRLGVNYGGVGAAGLYTAIEPGQYTFSGRIADSIPKANKNLPISNVAANIEAGKLYSFYQSGVYNAATKTVDGFVVEDAFSTTPDFSGAHVRFVNAVHNSNPMALFARDTATKQEYAIGGPVAYKSGGQFVTIPAGVYDLVTRIPGSATAVISRNAISTTGGLISFNAPRVYTITARGDINVTLGSAVNRRFLDNTINR